MKTIDYKILLNEHDNDLLKKYADVFLKKNGLTNYNANYLYELDQRYKLSALIDIYSGFYDPDFKSTQHALEYSKILVAFCHYDGKWIPEGKFQFNPPQMIATNEILEQGKKYENVSHLITKLLHEKQTSNITFFGMSSLLKEYKETCLNSELEIINQYFDASTNSFKIPDLFPKISFGLK